MASGILPNESLLLLGLFLFSLREQAVSNRGQNGGWWGVNYFSGRQPVLTFVPELAVKPTPLSILRALPPLVPVRPLLLSAPYKTMRARLPPLPAAASSPATCSQFDATLPKFSV